MDSDGYAVQEIRCCLNCDNVMISCNYLDEGFYDCYREGHIMAVDPLGICYQWRPITVEDDEE